MPMNANEKLRSWRMIRGMSQQDLATKIGSTRQWICRLEHGFLISGKTRRYLAEALGIPSRFLTDAAQDPHVSVLADTVILDDENAMLYQAIKNVKYTQIRALSMSECEELLDKLESMGLIDKKKD